MRSGIHFKKINCDKLKERIIYFYLIQFGKRVAAFQSVFYFVGIIYLDLTSS